MTVNTQTGLLGKSEILMEASDAYYSGKIHFVIDSGYAKTPYNWTFSLLGISAIALVIVLSRRKQN